MDKLSYDEYISRREYTKAESCTVQDEYGSNKQVHMKIDPFMTSVQTEDINTEQNANTNQDYRGGGDVKGIKKTIKTIS